MEIKKEAAGVKKTEWKLPTSSLAQCFYSLGRPLSVCFAGERTYLATSRSRRFNRYHLTNVECCYPAGDNGKQAHSFIWLAEEKL